MLFFILSTCMCFLVLYIKVEIVPVISTDEDIDSVALDLENDR